MHFHFQTLLASLIFVASATARFVMYADEWHPTRPTSAQDREGITHVVVAFAMANATASFVPKVSIDTIRTEFKGAKVMIAVGGWGDTIGFSTAAKTDDGIQKFATDAATMLSTTTADGIDIDWEYPGGNGADYKQTPNSAKQYEIDAFPKMLQAIRQAIGDDKLLSIAVPGKQQDMIAYTNTTGPLIWPYVDWVNIMSYDLMNRRDTVTAHHTSVVGTDTSIQNYLDIGCPPSKINLGFAFYAKYFKTEGYCSHPLGCPIVPAESPSGADTLTSGAWTFETANMKPIDYSKIVVSYDGTCGADKNTKCASACCSQYGNCGSGPQFCQGGCQHAFGTGCEDPDIFGSWQNASQKGITDDVLGGQYYYDAANSLFWTWDTTDLMKRKFNEIVAKYNLGGVMAWSLGEDSYDWSHIRAIAQDLNDLNGGGGQYTTTTLVTSTIRASATTSTETPATYKTKAPATTRASSTTKTSGYAIPTTNVGTDTTVSGDGDQDQDQTEAQDQTQAGDDSQQTDHTSNQVDGDASTDVSDDEAAAEQSDSDVDANTDNSTDDTDADTDIDTSSSDTDTSTADASSATPDADAGSGTDGEQAQRKAGSDCGTSK
ncbi:carbohydrate-binding module family 18 protein [Lophiostoma macrostomum CBS 122681]|uniref:chitinase n=1 Tax=Lophiostoma macrostomum CBS 122681 TaxID=1314788 RepID=A0A6A6SS44_9PLEO|nr:carbohydrate-binding module family 18 protein [Lophiostoma macrostomum CBS 122681]